MKAKTHYRVLRSTVVLARSSAVLAKRVTPELTRILDAVQTANYAFDQIKDRDLEHLFAFFDDEFTGHVRDEFTFYPDRDSVRVHDAPVAICELCGKGDSKDTHDNRDHLRIEYKLTNTAGGTDTWCGSTCIVNFGLKVDGAATAEEAERLLGMAMRRAVRQWEINAWRNANPEHALIPAHYQALRSGLPTTDIFGELRVAQIAESAPYPVRAMKQAAAFYQREGYLTLKKEAAWTETRKWLAWKQRVLALRQALANVTDPDEKIELLIAMRDAQNGESHEAA